MRPKCIVLFSGGLDSTLSLRLMVDQGVEVVAFFASNKFHSEENIPGLRKRALALGATEMLVHDLTDEMIAFTDKPRYGYGKNLNACLDCRICAITHGKQVMEKTGASFLVSGEVIGQRPMSQRRDAMAIVDRNIREMGLEGLLLRPLCAKLLPITIPEEKGWVDREGLHEISGRSRKSQIALAADFGITDYPNPAGGCLLTDAGFSARLKDLMEHKPDWQSDDIDFIKVGRHFRLDSETRIIASRNEKENQQLTDIANPGDVFFITTGRPGAIVLLQGPAADESTRIAAGLAVYYSKFRKDGEAGVESWQQEEVKPKDLGTCGVVLPETLKNMVVGAGSQ